MAVTTPSIPKNVFAVQDANEATVKRGLHGVAWADDGAHGPASTRDRATFAGLQHKIKCRYPQINRDCGNGRVSRIPVLQAAAGAQERLTTRDRPLLAGLQDWTKRGHSQINKDRVNGQPNRLSIPRKL